MQSKWKLRFVLAMLGLCCGAPSGIAADTTVIVEHWKAIAESNDVSLYNDHLVRFPDSPFKTVIEKRIAALRSGSPPAPAPAPAGTEVSTFNGAYELETKWRDGASRCMGQGYGRVTIADGIVKGSWSHIKIDGPVKGDITPDGRIKMFITGGAAIVWLKGQASGGRLEGKWTTSGESVCGGDWVMSRAD